MEALKFLLTSTFYPPYHLGGDAVHVKYLAEALARRGHEIHVMHSIDAYNLKRKEKREAKCSEGVFVHPIKLPLGKLDPLCVYLFGNSNFVLNEFSNLLREIKPDVVHHHNISLLGHKLFRKQGNYLNIYSAHDYWLICQRNDLFKYNKRICEKKDCFVCSFYSMKPYQFWRNFKYFEKNVKDIEFIIAPSRYITERMAEKIKVKIEYLPNFIPDTSIKRKIHSKDSFLFVGRLEKVKGILKLIEVFEDLKKKLILVGNGPLKSQISILINQLNLNDQVTFTERVNNEQLVELYRSSLALIIPSLWPENAPLVALEALSAGTPIISSNNGGLPEIVGKIDRHLIYENFLELRSIIDNFDKNRYSRENIKKIFKQNYSEDVFIGRYLRLVKQ